MQGKEASEQETRKCTAGVDVSKDWLDAHVLPAAQSLRVANTSAGIRQLKRWLLKYKIDLVAVEATGKFHRELCRSLRASHMAVAVIDPYRVRNYAKAERILAKTDRLDAKVLAMFAGAMNPACRPPPPQVIEDMQELVTARANAVEEETSLQNQLGSAQTNFLRRQLTRRIIQIKAHIRALEQECLSQIKADEALARRYTILTSIPGIGAVVAITLIAFLNELGALNNKEIGALAGVVPIPHDSGQREGIRVVWGGRGIVRRMLYLAALSASQHNKDMRIFRQRLSASGKSAKLCLIAVARKLAALANTLISENRIWQPTAPQNA
jgi:transposase